MAWPAGTQAPAWAVTDHGGRGDNVMAAPSAAAAAAAAEAATAAKAAKAAAVARQHAAAAARVAKSAGSAKAARALGSAEAHLEGGEGDEGAPLVERPPLVGGGETSRLVSLYDVWTDAAFGAFAKLPGVGLFLIIKKGCNPTVSYLVTV